MGQFDIEYAQTIPTGESGAVRANLNVDTGEGAIGRAVMQFGADAQRKYKEVRDAEERLQVSAGQRKIKEHIIAAQNSASGDDKRDEEIWKEAEANISSVEYESPRVSSELQMYKDSVMPEAIDGFGKKHLGMKAKNTHDSFVAEGQTLLAIGDLIAYHDLLQSRLDSQDITQAMFDSLSESALPDSLLQQARDLVSSEKAGDKQRGIGILNNIQSIEGVNLSTEQKEYQAKLLKLATKASSEQSNAAITEAVVKMHNMRKATALEKAEAAPEIIQNMLDGGVTGDNIQQYIGIVNEWAGEDKDPTLLRDEKTLAALRINIRTNPEEYIGKENEKIYPLVGKGTNGGITSKDAEDIVKSLQELPPMQKELANRKQHQLTAMYNSDKLSLESYNDLATRMTVYTNTNTNFTPEEMDKFFMGLVQGEVKGKWYINVASWLPPFSIGKSYRVAGETKQSFKDIDASIARTTRIREKMMTDRVIQRQLLEVGSKRLGPKGKEWVLVEKGRTPIEDVYERAE